MGDTDLLLLIDVVRSVVGILLEDSGVEVGASERVVLDTVEELNMLDVALGRVDDN